MTRARNGRHKLWSTSDVPEAERFAYYREAICEVFTDLSPEFDDSRPFNAILESITLANGSISRVRSTPHHTQRTPTQVSQFSEHSYTLYLQIESNCVIEQDGQSVRLAPGEIALFSSTVPFRLIRPTATDMSVLVFRLPGDVLEESRPWTPGIWRVSDHPFLGALIETTARALSRDALTADAADAELVLHTLTRLSAQACTDSPGGLAPEIVGPALLAAVLRYVESRLHDPALSVAEVAAHFGVSRRYVHKLFELTGRSFSHHVLSARLDKVASELRSPERARTAIAEVVYSNGFSDLSYFNRRFKARFEATPREIRKTARVCLLGKAGSSAVSPE